MPPKPDFAPVFSALRSILAEYEPRLQVVHDRPDYYYLNTYTIGPNKHPIAFGGVLFGDAGAIWSRAPIDLARATAVGTGGGLRIQWGETFVLRSDVEWSPTEDTAGFYLDLNQVF